MAKNSARSTIFNIHRWLGLHVGLFFIFMFATGTILIVSYEIEAVVYPNLWASAPDDGIPAGFGTIYESLTEKFPQGQVSTIERQPQPWLADRSLMTTGWGEDVVVWTDPTSGAFLEVTSARNFRAVLHELHDSLLVPRQIGFILVASTSFILMALVLAGLVTYRRFWRGLFRWPDKSSTGRERQGGLHRILAVWAFVFLLITAGTGTFFFVAGLGYLGSTPEPSPAQNRGVTIPAELDGALINRAEATAIAASGITPKNMAMPKNAASGILFSGYTATVGRLSGPTTVVIDPADLGVLGNSGPDEFRGNARLKAVMKALHFGQWGGQFSRLLWIILGIVVTTLAIAGLKIAVLRQNNDTPGLMRGVLRQLGLFKWAYALVILGVIAVGFMRFGPGAAKWTTLPIISAQSDSAKVQIFGTMRDGKPMQLRALINDDQLQRLRVRTGDDVELMVLEPANGEMAGEFSLVATPDANDFLLILDQLDGSEMILEYNLGAAIW